MRALGSWNKMNIYSAATMIIILLFSMIQPALSDPITTKPTAWPTRSTSGSTVSSATTTSSGPSRPSTSTSSSVTSSAPVTSTSPSWTTSASVTSSAPTTSTSASWTTSASVTSSAPTTSTSPSWTTSASVTSSAPTTSTSPSWTTPSSTGSTMTITTALPNVTSTYSNALNYNSPFFVRPHASAGVYFYYQAIQVTTDTPGLYSFTSSSSIDTYGCLYDGDFDPSYPYQNLITCDDDSGGWSQFLINSSLLQNEIYVLVVTTYSSGDIGSYSVIAVGPAIVNMTSYFVPSTTTSWMTTSTSSETTSSYSGDLNYNSPTFYRPYASAGSYYYYQAIQVTTDTPGLYSFTSSSSIDTYGCLYNAYFDPSYPYQYLITCDDDSGGWSQFLINSSLLQNKIYVLVVTTYSSGDTGSYTAIALGPGRVYMTSITPTSTVPGPTTTATVTTTYSNSFSSNSPTFTRPYVGNGDYYYQAIQIKVYTTDSYTFTSSEDIHTYGCLYDGDFDPYSPTENVIMCDDDSGFHDYFSITYQLSTLQSYTLVVTTYYSITTGSYTVQAMGPTRIDMTSMTPSTINPVWVTVGIIIISVTCAFVLVAIVSICVYRYKRRTPERQRLLSSNCSPNRSAQDVFAADGNRTLYTVPRVIAPPPIVEEAPPSYEAFMASSAPPQQLEP